MPPETLAGRDATLARLRLAIAAHAAAAPAPPSAPERPPIDRILQGEWRERPEGPIFVREEWYPLDHYHGRHPLRAPLTLADDALALLSRPEREVSPESLAFFDIETTGLAGGTGTYVILAGIGAFADGAFRLRQYFLADVAHERAMLAAVAEDLGERAAVVTYNGRAFDMPVTEARLALARLPSPAAALAHIDLLHPVRRLYRHRMPACTLAEAERRFLRIERWDDVPGRLIPSLYFDYVRAGRASPLRPVFRHNAEDVLSLVGILAAVAEVITSHDLPPEDAAAAAHWWDLRGARDQAMRLYRAALPWLRGEPEWARAAARHARLCRRAGEQGEAAALWRELWREGDASAGLALAKHLEHRERDFGGAAAIVRELLAAADTGAVPALEHRRRRLERRLAQPAARQLRRTA
jgi:uncharacterized protein YprB with RNaseH-like and TPR domain